MNIDPTKIRRKTKNQTVNLPYADKPALAKSYGYKLKIDYAVSAIGDFVTELTPLIEANANNYGYP